MKLLFHIVIGICVLGFTVLSAGVYEGLLGKYPIRMLLSDEAPYEGTYTYYGKLLSIPLEGESLSKLCEPTWHEKREIFKPFACFYGKIMGDVFRGKWQKVGSKQSLSFKLTRLVVPQVEDEYGASYNDELFYNKRLLEEMKFKKLPRAHQEKELTLVPYIEPITKVIRSRIELADKTVQKRINRTLQGIHSDDVLTSLECINEGYIETGNGIGKSVMREGGDVHVKYNHNPFLLLSYGGSIFCGGAHPSNYYDLYLFDSRTGERIYLEEMVSIYHEDENEYRSINPVFKILLESYLLREDEVNENCYSHEDNSNFLLYPSKYSKVSVYLTGMGHAGFVCETEPIALIPIEKLMPFILPKYQAYFKKLIEASYVSP